MKTSNSLRHRRLRTSIVFGVAIILALCVVGIVVHWSIAQTAITAGVAAVVGFLASYFVYRRGATGS